MMMRRSAVVASLTLAVAAVACIGLGAVLDRYVLLPRQFAARRASAPDDMRQRMRDRMARELSLSPEQQARIDTLTARNFRALEESRRTFEPRMDSLIRTLRASMDSVLTPAQRLTLDSLRARGTFGPPVGPFGRGAPPLPPAMGFPTPRRP